MKKANNLKKTILILVVTCLVSLISLAFSIFPEATTSQEAKAEDDLEPQILDASVESKIDVLNPRSNPQAGDNWIVSFETTGTADLTITPMDQATIDDLDFISLACDGEEQTPQILENDVIFYPNWSCEETSKIAHLVNVAGKHTLKFQFGDEVGYAYNSPTDVAPHNMTSNTSPAPYVISASSSANSAVLPYQAFDGSWYTWTDSWESANSSPGWLKIDMGAGNTYKIESYALQCLSSQPTEALAPARMPKNWTFQGSNDNSNWDELDAVTNETGWGGDGEKRTYTCDVSITAYRYFKLDVTANNGGPYILVGEMYLYVVEVSAPTVTTQAVDTIEETTATGHGTVTVTGGENPDHRYIEWGTTTSYGSQCDAGTGGTGAYSCGITSLSPGTKYYFRARAVNSAGTGTGSELNFTTKPNPPTSLSATTQSRTQIDVSWTKGSGAEKTMVRRKIDSAPTSVSDGDQAYFDTGSSFNDTSLSCGIHYFYRAWSYKTDAPNSGYSDEYASADASTGSVIENIPDWSEYDLGLYEDGRQITNIDNFTSYSTLSIKDLTSGKRVVKFDIIGNVDMDGVKVGTAAGQAWIDGLTDPDIVSENRELYVPFSGGVKKQTVWVCEGYSGDDGSAITKDNCQENGGNLDTWIWEGSTYARQSEDPENYTDVTLAEVNETDNYYKLANITGTAGGDGENPVGEGGEEAVPEFTTLTFIIAAVAGFGIYLLIRRRALRKEQKK